MGPTTITAADFTIDPSTVQDPQLFDRVVLANHSQYLMDLRNGRQQHWLHPFMADIFEFDPNTQISVTPMLMDLVIPGAAQHFTATFLQPGEDQAAGSTYPCAMSVYVSPPQPNPEFWAMRGVSINVTNTEAMATMNIVEGWADVPAAANHYTVPAGKRLVVANIELNGRPTPGGPFLYEARFHDGNTIVSNIMFSMSTQTAALIGAPTTGVVPGAIQTPFFGTRAVTLTEGQTIGVGLICGGAGTGTVDIVLVGTLEDTL